MAHKSSHVNNNYTGYSYRRTYYEYDFDTETTRKITRVGTYWCKNKSPRPTHKPGYSFRYRGAYARRAQINAIDTREQLAEFSGKITNTKFHRDTREKQALICDWDGVYSRRSNDWKRNKHAKHQYEWHKPIHYSSALVVDV